MFEELSNILAVSMTPQQIVGRLQKLHQLYTEQRDKISQASSLSAEDCAAYTFFYLPPNYAKLQFLLRHLGPVLQQQLARTIVIDVGSGPGTFSLAWHDLLNPIAPYHQSWALEINSAMSTIAQKLLSTYRPSAQFNSVSQINQINPQAGLDITVIFGNSFNEMSPSECQKILEKFKPKYILMIEPGTPEVFNKLMEFRKNYLNQDYQCLYPCPQGKADCPMVAQADWCHQLMRYQPDPWLSKIAQKLEIDRQRMPLLAHCYQRSTDRAQNSIGTLGRSVRFMGDYKHAVGLQLCLNSSTSEHAGIELREVEFLKRSLDKVSTQKLLNIEVGEEINGEWLKLLDEKNRRWRANFAMDEK